MILHSIKKYASRYSSYVSPAPPPQLPSPQQQHVRLIPNALKHNYDKLGYAQFLNRIGIDKGDYLVSKSALFPFEDKDFVKVINVQEIHWMCGANTQTREPECLQVRNILGTEFWTCPSYYIKWAGETKDLEDKFK